MKKYFNNVLRNNIIFFLFAILASGSGVEAQISKGGLPLSIIKNIEFENNPEIIHKAPEWKDYLTQENKLNNKSQVTGPVKVGLHVNTDFGFPGSGQFIGLNNGEKIWKGVISIPQAPAMGLLFNRFVLPKGVKLFLVNENKKQIVGAFDSENNDDSKRFATDAVQGSKIYVELNIDSGVNLDEIELHIDKVLVFYRGIEHLNKYLHTDPIPLDNIDIQLNGLSSECMINAICPQGINYSNPRKATVQTIDMLGGSSCSGTLVTNTGNTATNCKAYIYTASHCEPSGETTANAPVFSQYMVRFNFERPTCDNSGATNAKSMTGVNLLARSSFRPGFIDTITLVKGDFMLLELRQPIPSDYGAILSGWDRSTSISTSTSLPKTFIGFHHPKGDNKKLSTSQSIASYSWPSQQLNPSGSRWVAHLEVGYVEPGSSGSGLFNDDGYVIGDLSTGGIFASIPNNCYTRANGQPGASPLNRVSYQKLSNAWEYNENGIIGANNLKQFLDPVNTGVERINSVTQACEQLTSGGGTETGVTVSDLVESIDDNIAIYPNPATNGNVQLQYNFSNITDLHIDVVDITGKVLYESSLKGAKTGVKRMNLQHIAPGMYVIRIKSKNIYAYKKLILNK